MYIKEYEYENIAYIVVGKHIDSAKRIISEGKSPAAFDADHAIHNWLPEKYLDENTSETDYWTRHNERKLKKYIRLEIMRRKLNNRLEGKI